MSLPCWNIPLENHQNNCCFLAVLRLCIHALLNQQDWYFCSRTGKGSENNKGDGWEDLICFCTKRVSRQGFISHEKRLVGWCDRDWPNPQLGEGHSISCSMRTSADCLHLGGHTLRWVGAIKKEQEVDPPTVRVVPTKLFSMACDEYK